MLDRPGAALSCLHQILHQSTGYPDLDKENILLVLGRRDGPVAAETHQRACWNKEGTHPGQSQNGNVAAMRGRRHSPHRSCNKNEPVKCRGREPNYISLYVDGACYQHGFKEAAPARLHGATSGDVAAPQRQAKPVWRHRVVPCGMMPSSTAGVAMVCRATTNM